MSKWALGTERVGRARNREVLRPEARAFLHNARGLSVVDVTGVAGSDAGNGHGYFRSRPWVSSDVRMNLMHGLAPEERGLEQDEDSFVWVFPEDYIARLRARLLGE